MISPSSALALIEPGDSMDITQVHAELSWIESRALDAGNSQGDTMAGPLTTPGLVLGGVPVSTNAMFYFGTDSGTVNSLTVTTSFPSGMAKGQVIAVKVANTNTGSATLNVNSLGAYSILQGGMVLTGGELPAAGWVLLEFDGSYWNVIGMAPGGSPNVAGSFKGSFSGTFSGAWTSLPSGTQAVFFQSSAPSGWTQNTSVNDQVLRVVSGNGGGTGGSWSVNGFSFGSHSHYFDHQHDTPVSGPGPTGANSNLPTSPPWGTGASINIFYTNESNNSGYQNQNAFRSSYISNSATGNGTNTGDTGGTVSNDGSWRPAYINVIVASKN